MHRGSLLTFAQHGPHNPCCACCSVLQCVAVDRIIHNYILTLCASCIPFPGTLVAHALRLLHWRRCVGAVKRTLHCIADIKIRTPPASTAARRAMCGCMCCIAIQHPAMCGCCITLRYEPQQDQPQEGEQQGARGGAAAARAALVLAIAASQRLRLRATPHSCAHRSAQECGRVYVREYVSGELFHRCVVWRDSWRSNRMKSSSRISGTRVASRACCLHVFERVGLRETDFMMYAAGVRRVKGEFFFSPDMRWFPFDSQQLGTYIYIYIRIYICATHMYIYAYIWIYIYAQHICIYMHMRICICTHMRNKTLYQLQQEFSFSPDKRWFPFDRQQLCTCICISIYIYVQHICIHKYTYIYMHTMYVHMYIWRNMTLHQSHHSLDMRWFPFDRWQLGTYVHICICATHMYGK